MLIIGLTGSIGMGKSATAGMFRARGIPVFDADQAVHDLYAGEAAPKVEVAFPGTMKDGRIDRQELGRRVLDNPKAMARLEAIVHPLVQAAEDAFLAAAAEAGSSVAVIEVPLLLESGIDDRCDLVTVVSAPAQTQRERVLARPGMDEQKFEAILARQMSDAQKRERAHVVIPTGEGFAVAEKAVDDLLRSVACMPGSAYANRLARS